MSIQTINLGAAANDGTGDDARLAGQKINSNFAYLETLINNAAAAIEQVYDDNADLIADQSNQTISKLYLVKDARTAAEITASDPVYFAIYEYLGTTDEDIDDYNKLDADETAAVVSQTGVGVKTVKGLEETYGTTPLPPFGGVYVYKDGSGNITKFKFDKPYSGFLAKLATNAGSNTYKFVITNKSQGNTLMATISSFTFLDPFYEVNIASGITESELSVDDILDFSLPDIDNEGSGGSSLYLGQFTSLANLETAYPAASATAGQWAIIDVVSEDARKALLDVTDDKWVLGGAVSGGAGALEYQTPITSTGTTLDGSQKGLNKVYPFENASAQTITITTGDYVENDVINIERRGQGTVEIIADTGVRIRGVRDVENRYFINDVNGIVALLCRGGEEFGIIGNLKRGYSGAVTTSNYTALNEGDVAVDVVVTGTGFSDNMLVSVSANATLNSFTVQNPTQCTLNLTAVGVENDTVTVTYDNGGVFVDTDAITIIASSGIPVADLIAYYRWNNSGVDEINSYDASVTGTSYITGKSGQAIDFTGGGATNFALISDNSAFSFGNGTTDVPFSVSLYVKFNSLGASGTFIIKRDINIASDAEYLFLINSSNEISFTLYSQSSSDYIRSSTSAFTPSTATWYHVVYTYDGSGLQSGMKIYIDGVLQSVADGSAGTYVAMNDSSANVKIGALWSNSTSATNALDGAIDGLGFWDKELSSTEVTAIYNEQNGGNEIA